MPEVDTIVANAVSLHTVVPPVSKFKISRILPLVRPFFRYLDPQWGNDAPDLKAKAMLGFVKLTHRECRNDVCRLRELHLRHGLADAVAPREPERRDSRVDQAASSRPCR